MNDTIITSGQKRKELIIFAACIGIAFCANILSIIIYKTNWIELFTQLHIVAGFGLFIYLILAVIRMLFFAAKTILKKLN